MVFIYILAHLARAIRTDEEKSSETNIHLRNFLENVRFLMFRHNQWTFSVEKNKITRKKKTKLICKEKLLNTNTFELV